MHNHIIVTDSCVMKLKKKRRRNQIELQTQREFIKLAEKFRKAEAPSEVRRLGHKLGKMVFGK